MAARRGELIALVALAACLAAGRALAWDAPRGLGGRRARAGRAGLVRASHGRPRARPGTGRRGARRGGAVARGLDAAARGCLPPRPRADRGHRGRAASDRAPPFHRPRADRPSARGHARGRGRRGRRRGVRVSRLADLDAHRGRRPLPRRAHAPPGRGPVAVVRQRLALPARPRQRRIRAAGPARRVRGRREAGRRGPGRDVPVPPAAVRRARDRRGVRARQGAHRMARGRLPGGGDDRMGPVLAHQRARAPDQPAAAVLAVGADARRRCCSSGSRSGMHAGRRSRPSRASRSSRSSTRPTRSHAWRSPPGCSPAPGGPGFPICGPRSAR